MEAAIFRGIRNSIFFKRQKCEAGAAGGSTWGQRNREGKKVSKRREFY